jgi:hypothetical protein
LVDACALGGFAGLELIESRDDGRAENVDKTLSGIEAVQTLSRLNRAHPQKHDSESKPRPIATKLNACNHLTCRTSVRGRTSRRRAVGTEL